MGTRSTIALEFADGTVQQVYCHWDGYLDHNGQILSTHYMDPFKVRDLIDLGDMSTLGSDVTPGNDNHSFESPKMGVCVFYMRDRGERDCNARRYQNVDEYFAECQQEEYDYILREVEGKAVWYVRCYATDGKWVTLAEAEALQNKMNTEGVY